MCKNIYYCHWKSLDTKHIYADEHNSSLFKVRQVFKDFVSQGTLKLEFKVIFAEKSTKSSGVELLTTSFVETSLHVLSKQIFDKKLH